MKHWKCFYIAILAAFLTLSSGKVNAQTDGMLDLAAMDSVDISFITCGPGQEVWSLYGHTAIRVNDRGRGEDLAINYGIFSFEKSFFVLRFIFGLTDYEMGIDYFDDFLESYRRHGRWVKEQPLNLSREEKQQILQALAVNYLPENRVYRYNYFYDNCTTRARDIIEQHVNGTVKYTDDATKATWRDLIHSYTEEHRWARFGNDLLLGLQADRQTTQMNRQFLPFMMMNQLDGATVVDEQGASKKLTGEVTTLNEAVDSDGGSCGIYPIHCAIALALLIVGVTVFEYVSRKNFWGVDLVLGLVLGLCGLILTAMIFSQHPTVRLNTQILVLCPLWLVFLYPTLRRMRKGQSHFWLTCYCCLICIFLVLCTMQKPAEGIFILALSLLIRYWLKHKQLTKNA